jgi:predicted XRE-type DNA-binding protein
MMARHRHPVGQHAHAYRETHAMTAKTMVAQSTGNVFADIGLPNAEHYALKAEIVLTLAKRIKRSELSQNKAASIIGIA